MTLEPRKNRRWLHSVIEASAEPLPTFPWMRGQKVRPSSLDLPAQQTKAVPRPLSGFFGRKRAIAAR